MDFLLRKCCQSLVFPVLSKLAVGHALLMRDLTPELGDADDAARVAGICNRFRLHIGNMQREAGEEWANGAEGMESALTGMRGMRAGK